MSNMQITGGHLKWGAERGKSTMLGYISHVPLVPRTRRGIMPQLLTLAESRSDQLVAIAGNFHAEDRKHLVRSGVAVFDDPVAATRAVAKLVRAGRAFSFPEQDPHPAASTAVDVRRALSLAGIWLVPESTILNENDTQAALEEHGSIALKIRAPGLCHKTELGGVEIGIDCAEQARRAYARLAARAAEHAGEYPGSRITASPMVEGVEIFVGTRHDPHFGPLVMVGSGGTMCELFDDTKYAKTPISRDTAESMIASIRVAPMLDGWRGSPAVDKGALLDAVVALSGMAAELPSLEFNPLIATPAGVACVDLLIHGEGARP